MLQPPRRLLILVSGVLLSATVAAQQGPPPTALTADDYARAERFMSYNTSPLVLHSGVRPTWITGDRFWYRTTGDKGAEAWLVEAAKGTRVPCDLEPCKTDERQAKQGPERVEHGHQLDLGVLVVGPARLTWSRIIAWALTAHRTVVIEDALRAGLTRRRHPRVFKVVTLVGLVHVHFGTVSCWPMLISLGLDNLLSVTTRSTHSETLMDAGLTWLQIEDSVSPETTV